jgi:hypothetical protein
MTLFNALVAMESQQPPMSQVNKKDVMVKHKTRGQ